MTKFCSQSLANNNDIEGITTGIPKLDTITGGLKKGELIVLAARTSIGKTSIALYMALQAEKASPEEGKNSTKCSATSYVRELSGPESFGTDIEPAAKKQCRHY